MTAADTARQTKLIQQLFVAGYSQSEIAERMSCTTAEVRKAIAKQAKAMTDRHDSEIRNQLYAERLETLLKAVWPAAVKGDLKAVEEARRLLEQQERLDVDGVQ